METRDIFANLSPLDHRYYLSNRELFDRLSNYLSERAMVCYCARVEAALLGAHIAERGMDGTRYRRLLDELPDRIDPDEVYAEEEQTRHNIRALVNVIVRGLPEELRSLTHLGATSVDILDTANALRIRDAVRRVVLPLLIELHEAINHHVRRHADTVQVGRTHGQHGVPITFGFALAEYLSRLGSSIEAIAARTSTLRGKLAGAVGAYNSLSLIVADPREFESRVLAELDLQVGEHATQMVEPEPLLRLLQELANAFGVIANLADDLRNLQRSEIAEVAEMFGSNQVGSSTMPQKRNPWNSEHVKSLWKAFIPRLITFQMDQISEHQRDLTNSASGRFVGEFVAGLCAAAERMRRVVTSLKVNEQRMRSNLASGGGSVLAEAAYTLLAATGEPAAHERIRQLTLDNPGRPLGQALRTDVALWAKVEGKLAALGLPSDFFSEEARYTGCAAARARAVSDEFARRLQSLKEELDAIG